MSRLIESIKLFDRKLWNIEYHNERMNRSRRELFNAEDELDLSLIIKIPEGLSNNLFKCRVVYTEKILDVEFHPYIPRPVKKLNIVHDDNLDYSYKYEERSKIQKHLCNAVDSEILIVKNGFVSDTSYSNVVFSDLTDLFTPATPLLKGTKRASLLDSGKIREKEIRLADLPKYKYVYLINALLDIDEELRIPVENIYQ